jgi:starvation-inducible DNA-binding protein
MSATTVDVRRGLRKFVADLHTIAFKALDCHWNVGGVHFGPLHALFGAEYDFLLETQDTLAERVRALGGLVDARPATLLKAATVKEESLMSATPDAMLRALLADYEHVIRELREAIKATAVSDPVTQNSYQDVCAAFEKHAWMIRMHVVTPLAKGKPTS